MYIFSLPETNKPSPALFVCRQCFFHKNSSAHLIGLENGICKNGKTHIIIMITTNDEKIIWKPIKILLENVFDFIKMHFISTLVMSIFGDTSYLIDYIVSKY